MRRLSKALVFTLLLIPLQACALSGEAVEGRVLEEETNKPIPGAIVVVRWEGYVSIFPAETRNVCVHVASTTTDDQGRYHFPTWHKEAHIQGVKDLKPNVTAHQPGYHWSERYEKNVQYLKPVAGGRGERLKAARLAGVMCGSADESQKNLIPLYRALYEEARNLAVTKEDKLIVNDLLYKIDLVELPYAEVLRRVDERNEMLRKEFPQ